MQGTLQDIWLEKMPKIVFKSTIVGENFVIYWSQMAKIVFKSTMVGENFEICLSQMAKMYVKENVWDFLLKKGLLGSGPLKRDPFENTATLTIMDKIKET